MDLQEASNAATHQHSHVSSMSSLDFGGIIGSLGSVSSQAQSVAQEDDGEIEMERVEYGVVVADGAP